MHMPVHRTQAWQPAAQPADSGPPSPAADTSMAPQGIDKRLGLAAVLLLATAVAAASDSTSGGTAGGTGILVVGSVNVDTTVHLDRLPLRSETKLASQPTPTLAVGGKGANQAVAAARLLSATPCGASGGASGSSGSDKQGAAAGAVRFVGRLGDDGYLPWLMRELKGAGLDLGATLVVPNMTTGLGIVW